MARASMESQATSDDGGDCAVPFRAPPTVDQWNSVLALRLEKFRKDLVTAVETLQRQIDYVEGRSPALAALWRAKLARIPPCWQANLDALEALLRPVPFSYVLRARSPCRGSSSSSAHVLPEDDACTSGAGSDDHCVVRSTGGGGAAAALQLVPCAAPPPRYPPFAFTAAAAAPEPGYDDAYAVLCHVVRDWSVDGAAARAAALAPILGCLREYLPLPQGAVAASAAAAAEAAAAGAEAEAEAAAAAEAEAAVPAAAAGGGEAPLILVPGAGLGRLAVELAARGWRVRANERSACMCAAAHAIISGALRDCRGGGADADSSGGTGAAVGDSSSGGGGGGDGTHSRGGGGGGGSGGGGSAGGGAGGITVYPYLHDAPHDCVRSEARFRAVAFPDAAGRAVTRHVRGRLSWDCGDFLELYGSRRRSRSGGSGGGGGGGAFDGVVTCFFLDTAPDVLEYVAALARVLRRGGVWVNLGPLHFHRESRVVASADELTAVLREAGFEVLRAAQLLPCEYRRGEPDSTATEQFRPLLWAARLTCGGSGSAGGGGSGYGRAGE